jgi:DNA-binding GntR family transcriptional regulator
LRHRPCRNPNDGSHWGQHLKAEDLQIPRQSATLRLQVEERIRAAIAHGIFKPGQRLVERELCEQIGVGRTSVREALRQLEAEGLVTVYPHRGPVVSTLSADEARHLYDLRALLEGHAGKMFAQRHTAQDMASLDGAFEAFAAAVESGQQGRLIETKNVFYGVLLDGSGNPYLKQMLTIIHNRVNLLRVTSMAQPGRIQNSLSELKHICAMLRERRPEEAQSACVAHIREAAKIVERVLGQSDVSSRAALDSDSAATVLSV